MSQLEVRNLSKKFQEGGSEVEALQNVSFKVNEHEFVAVLGPSGCGKTTLLRVIAGLVSPSSGEVVYHGNNKSGDIGFVFQDYALFDWKTVEENLVTAQKMADQKVSHERVETYLEMVDLKEFSDSYPGELSGGMRQRLGVARALIYDPDLVLMDEPFGALDELTKESLYSDFREILEETDKTVIYVTHDIEEAYLFADRMLVFSETGNIAEEIDLSSKAPREKEVLSTEQFFDTKDKVMDVIGGSEHEMD